MVKSSDFRKGISRAMKYKAKYNKAKYYAKRKNRQVTFTEVFVNKIGILNTNTGYNLTFSAMDIPQMNEYSALYARFRIKKAEFHLIPIYNQAQVSTSITPAALARIAYAVSDTPAQVAPTSELDVLQDNGCKVKLFDRKVKITCYPKPYVSFAGSAVTNIYPAFSQKKLYWLNTDNPNNDPSSTGVTVEHGGASVFMECPNNIAYCNVITKVWIELADPQ